MASNDKKPIVRQLSVPILAKRSPGMRLSPLRPTGSATPDQNRKLIVRQLSYGSQSSALRSRSDEDVFVSKVYITTPVDKMDKDLQTSLELIGHMSSPGADPEASEDSTKPEVSDQTSDPEVSDQTSDTEVSDHTSDQTSNEPIVDSENSAFALETSESKAEEKTVNVVKKKKKSEKCCQFM